MPSFVSDNAMVDDYADRVKRGEMTRSEALRDCAQREECSGITWVVINFRIPFVPDDAIAREQDQEGAEHE